MTRGYSFTVQSVNGLSRAEKTTPHVYEGMFRVGLESLFADCNLELQFSSYTDSSCSKAIVLEEELARALDTCRRGCYGL